MAVEESTKLIGANHNQSPTSVLLNATDHNQAIVVSILASALFLADGAQLALVDGDTSMKRGGVVLDGAET